MLVFCHLFVGSAIGLAVSGRMDERRLGRAGLAGGFLPDLLDKPLGHLLLTQTLDNGRLVGHSLLFLFVLLAAGAILHRERGGVAGFVLALGVLSHQLLDAMWRDPIAWCFPFLGPFVPGHYPDFFVEGLMAEIGSLTEWIFGAATLALLFTVARSASAPEHLDTTGLSITRLLAAAVGFMGVLSLAGATGILPPLAEISGTGDSLILATAAVVSSAIVLAKMHDGAGREVMQELRQAQLVQDDHTGKERGRHERAEGP